MCLGSATRKARENKQRVLTGDAPCLPGSRRASPGTRYVGRTRYFSGPSVRPPPPPDLLIQAASHRVSRKDRIPHRIGEPRAADVDALVLQLVQVAAGFDVAAQEARQIPVVRLDDREPLVGARRLEA